MPARSAAPSRDPARPRASRPPARVERAGLGLAERLVRATEELLEQEGLEGVTLRRVARHAGVTHGAPLRHYPRFSNLLAEVAARGFRMLSRAVDEAASQVAPGAGATARLVASAHAYVRCAVARPALFTLMFRPEVLDPAHPELARESVAAFEQVVRLVRAAQDAGWRTDTDTRRLAGALWASVHGLALLFAQGAYPAVVPGTRLDEAVATTLGLVLADAPPRRTA